MGAVFASKEPLQHRRHRINNDGLLQLPEKPILSPADYKFRPRPLEDFPLYFFLSACTLTRELGRESMDWVSIGGHRQRFCQMEPIRSRAFPELPLRDASHRPIHRYSHYVHLATDSSWRVPILHARLPRLPEETATSFEKGSYALFLMLFFRPHRDVCDFVRFCTLASAPNMQKASQGKEEEESMECGLFGVHAVADFRHRCSGCAASS